MDTKDIWLRPVHLSYLQPKLTDTMVGEAEEKLGYKLPQAYIDLLKIQNGGYIRYSLPDYDLSHHSVICGIGPYYPNIVDERAPLADSADLVSFATEGLLPLDGDGHWYLCLDYRDNSAEPALTYIDLGLDEQKKVADDFEEYLAQLGYYHYEDADEDAFGYVIETERPISEVVKLLEERTRLRFDISSDDEIGVTYRSMDGPPFVFIGTNRVRYGTVNPEDDRYDELKPLTNGSAVRFAEVPASALTFSCYDDSDTRMIVDALSPDFTVKHMREYIPIINVLAKESEDWSNFKG